MLASLDKLAELIEEFETDAVDLVEELIPQLSGSGLESEFKKIARHIENYEFDEAQQVFDQFLEKLKSR